jgi:hypothetical protein
MKTSSTPISGSDYAYFAALALKSSRHPGEQKK